MFLTFEFSLKIRFFCYDDAYFANSIPKVNGSRATFSEFLCLLSVSLLVSRNKFYFVCDMLLIEGFYLCKLLL